MSMSQIRIGLIGGSGLGQALGSAAEGTRHEVDTPFGKPSDAIVETNWEGLPIFVLQRHGPGHLLGPTQVPFRANIFAMKKLGVTHIIASGAVGSLREQLKPRELVIPDQIIDKTSRRPATFFEKAAAHVEFAEPFCPMLRKVLVEEGQRDEGTEGRSGKEESSSNPSSLRPSVSPSLSPSTFKVHDRGCYVCMEGPAFSTRAESLMHRLWGGDLIGMTAMPEAKLAREAEISYALIALVTDYDCWRKRPPAAGETSEPGNASELLAEIIANLKAASDNGMALIRRAVARIAAEPGLVANSPAHESLKLAIWSDKEKIPPEEVELLGPLWMRYFDSVK
jgi:5'-methylthioadenosine phosphorylase